ncbi:MAG: DUF993 family protein [Planctomycetota bacterium]|jgi:hypothetical protein|nr:DUF993 family protein [Planctomycetota bacterium]MDP6762298.1 DUF993 family protein [Planctomycetota bacterium]MDP6990314.1 DUF993 family protein [Planctomycetota bacterium]
MEFRRLDAFREELEDRESPAPVRRAAAALRVVVRDDAGEGGELSAVEAIDWDATAALRRRADRLGFAIAEAMDTAQRFRIGWPAARRLIETTGALDLGCGFIAGAGYDQLDTVADRDEVVAAVVEQARIIQAAGGEAMILSVPWLTRQGADEEAFVETYAAIFEALEGPLYVHWLGEMFLPELAGNFPGASFERVMALAPEKVRGTKLSLLDAERERTLRRALAANDQVVFTGDDLHFCDLIRGEGPAERTVDVGGRELSIGPFSHALLGVFDAIAGPASLALRFLARGDERRYEELMRPCEELGRWLFRAPTMHYKAGLAFLSWLNGLQDNPRLFACEERGRDREHLFEAARLAAAAGCLEDPDLANQRLASIAGGR